MSRSNEVRDMVGVWCKDKSKDEIRTLTESIEELQKIKSIDTIDYLVMYLRLELLKPQGE